MEDLKQELLRHTHAIWGFKEAGIVIDNIDIIVHSDKFLLRLETTIHPKKDIDYFAFGINQKKNPDLSTTYYLDFDWDSFGYKKMSPYIKPQRMTIERWINEDPSNVGSIELLVYCKKD